jgi:hypothetical protein
VGWAEMKLDGRSGYFGYFGRHTDALDSIARVKTRHKRKIMMGFMTKRLENPKCKRVVADTYGLVVVMNVEVLKNNSSQSTRTLEPIYTNFIRRQ